MYKLLTGDVRKLVLPQVQCVITSPPYYNLRDYGHVEQIGRESSVEDYVSELSATLDSLPLVETGTMFVNLGDSYVNGSLAGVPWRVCLALLGRGWYLRNEIIWHRNRVMPESAKNRFTRCHEHIFFLTRIPSKYTFNAGDVREIAKCANDRRAGKGRHIYKETRGQSAHTAAVMISSDGKRNRRSVWTIETAQATKHHATYPTELTDICVLAGSNRGDTVLDPFSGTGTTGVSALSYGRNYIGVDVSPEFTNIAETRLTTVIPVQ